MSGPFQPDPGGAQPEYSPGNVIDRGALEQALQETIDAASSGTPIDPAEMQAIREVATRHTSGQITLDIAADLIQAVLVTHYRALRASASFWQTIARDIARTLCDDPQAEARLNTLWQRLRKEGP